MKYSSTSLSAAALGLLCAAGLPGRALAQDAAAIPRVEVSGTSASGQQQDYTADSADSLSRTRTPLKDQAASIQVVPQAVLRDRAVTRTDQLIENVSGVLPESSYGGNGATFFNIRGFSENNGLRDGFRNFGYFAFRDVQNIEQVEVFKGPAGALYGGVGAVGGYVNTVSKRPMASPLTEAGLTVGSDALARATLDANRALGEGLWARLNVAAERNSTARDNAGYRSWSLAPAITWRPDGDTSLTLLAEFNHLQRDGFDFGVPNVPNYRDLSRSRYYGLPAGLYPDGIADFGRNDTQSYTALFDHGLSRDWTLRVAAQYSHAHQVSTQTFPNSTSPVDGRLDFTTYAGADEASTQTAVRAELLGELRLAGLQHTILAGADLGHLAQGGQGSKAYALTLDLLDPSYHSGLTYVDTYGSHQGRGRDVGLYAQDQIALSPRLSAFAALRADRFTNTALVGGAETGHNSETALSPRLGLVWQATDQTTVFADWSRSHAPNVGHAANENTFAAEVAQQTELGVRQQFLDKRLLASAALFKLNRTNILTTDPLDPNRQVLTGRQGSQGLELDVAGSLAKAWKLMANYTYTDAVVQSDTHLPSGDRLSNVPRHHASLWSICDIDALPGLGVGAGVYYVGQREASLPNTYTLAGYARTDVALSYRHEAWRLQLNINNLFNRAYYTGGSAGSFNYTLDPSRPRSVQLTASYQL